jgi:hypothetical protein
VVNVASCTRDCTAFTSLAHDSRFSFKFFALPNPGIVSISFFRNLFSFVAPRGGTAVRPSTPANLLLLVSFPLPTGLSLPQNSRTSGLTSSEAEDNNLETRQAIYSDDELFGINSTLTKGIESRAACLKRLINSHGPR